MEVEVAKKHKFIKDWVKQNLSIFEDTYPEVSRKDLKEYLYEVAAEQIKVPKAKLHNNYAHKEIEIDLLTLVDWIDNVKPITAGFGVFFKDQTKVKNPAAVMLQEFMTLRKTYKKNLHHLDPESYEYQMFDRLQLTEKVNANSYYGAGGRSMPLNA